MPRPKQLRKLTPLQRSALAVAASGMYELVEELAWSHVLGQKMQRRFVRSLIGGRNITPQLAVLRKRKFLTWQVDTTTNTIKIKLTEDGQKELDQWT